MTRFDAVNYISHGIAKVPSVESSSEQRRLPKGAEEGAEEEQILKTGKEVV